jgi:hypothetical protein
MVVAALDVGEYLEYEYDEDEEEVEVPRVPAPQAKVSGDWKNKPTQTPALMPRQPAGGNKMNRYAVAIANAANAEAEEAIPVSEGKLFSLTISACS